MELQADLHVHTCLSPCADRRMLPSVIAGAARAAGLDVIAVCDHNAAANVAAVREAGRREGLWVIGGMEITSAEEVHVLAYFGGGEGLAAVEAEVSRHLPGLNDVDRFGEQTVVDADDRAVREDARRLIGATTLSVEAIVNLVHAHGGAAAASHVDREGFSLLGQLGLVPEGLALDALEVSARCAPAGREAFRRWGLPLLASSDAHRPEDLGRARTVLTVEAATFDEFRWALAGTGGRRVRL